MQTDQMSDRTRNIFEMAKRVKYLGTQNPQLATEKPVTVALFEAFGTGITRLEQAGMDKVSSSGAGKSETRNKAARSREMRADLRRIKRTALILEKRMPEFQNSFILPEGDMSYEQMLVTTEAFLRDKVPYESGFDDYGLDKNFFDNLRENADGFDENAEKQANAKNKGVGTTAETGEITKDIIEARKELKTVLENHFRRDADKLAEWLSASHIERREYSKENEPENPTA